MSNRHQRGHPLKSIMPSLLTVMLFLGISQISIGCGGGGGGGGGGAPAPSPQQTTVLASLQAQSNVNITTNTGFQTVSSPSDVLVTSATGPSEADPNTTITVAGTGLHITINGSQFQVGDVSSVTVRSGDTVRIYEELPQGRSPDPTKTIRYTHP